MKLKDYNTTAKMYQLFLQFQKGQFDNSTHGVRYLNKFFNKAKNEPTIISSWDITELTDSCQNGEHRQIENTFTLKDYIYRICENKHFNDKKFSVIKTEIFQLVNNLTQIPRDLINFNIIMRPRGNNDGDGWKILTNEDKQIYDTKNNNITENTIYNNKDYVLTVNITTPLNDLMRFSLFFYQKWMDVIEGKRLMQDGYKKTLESYKSDKKYKELLNEKKLLTQIVSNNRQDIKKLNDLIDAQKIDLTMRDRFIQKLENKQEKEVNIEFDELISKKDNEIKRLTKENEDFLKLINERDLIIQKQSENLRETIKQIKIENRELKDNIIYLDKENKKLNNLLDKKEWINDSLKNLTSKLKEKEEFIKRLDTTFNMQYDLAKEISIKYQDMKKISEDLAIQNNELWLKLNKSHNFSGMDYQRTNDEHNGRR